MRRRIVVAMVHVKTPVGGIEKEKARMCTRKGKPLDARREEGWAVGARQINDR